MRALVLTLETIAAHTSTEGKVQAAAAYLASQDASRVGVAARFLAGTPLPPGTPATGIGRSTVIDLVSAFTGAARRDLLRRATTRGDLGLAVAEVLEASPPPLGPRLSLTEVSETLLRLGKMGGARRSQQLQALLERASPVEGKYLTKLLLGALRTGMQGGRVEEAIALAFDQPPALVRRAHMLLGDIGTAAERASAGALERVSLQALRPVRLMLAHAADDAETVAGLLPPPLIAEHKYDGIRAQLHLIDGEIRLFSRALEDFTHFFPEVRCAPPGLRREWILDGEVVAWHGGRCLSFGTLQRRLGRKQVPLTLLLDAPVIFLAFDALRAESEDLVDAPLQRRKELLARLPTDGPVRRAPWRLLQSDAEIDDWYADVLREGSEGAVFKDPDSPYRPGTRGRSWVKLKRPMGTLDVVVTGAEYGQGKRAGLLSDLIFAVRDVENGGFLDTGRAYSGLTDVEIGELTAILEKTTLRRTGPARRVEPRVVLEVAFDDVRRSARHPSGYALRFPRIVRRRVDLRPDEIASVEDLRTLEERGAR